MACELGEAIQKRQTDAEVKQVKSDLAGTSEEKTKQLYEANTEKLDAAHELFEHQKTCQECFNNPPA
jgi:hypothetical protein